MSIKNLYKLQTKYINNSIDNIEGNLDALIEHISSLNGILFLTGVGKNGHVAAKAASTFASIGIRSMFINPVDAVHGDMGNIKDDDIIFAISTSGNTDELLNFIVNVKNNNLNNKIFLLTSNKSNKIKKYCDHCIILPIEKEIDEFNIVPTVSIAAYTVLLQSIGIYVSQKNGFNLKKFKNNHPGGNIGRLLNELS